MKTIKLELDVIITYEELKVINETETTYNKIVGNLYLTFTGIKEIKDNETDILISAFNKDDETELPYFTTLIDLRDFKTDKDINEAIYKQLFLLY